MEKYTWSVKIDKHGLAHRFSVLHVVSQTSQKAVEYLSITVTLGKAHEAAESENERINEIQQTKILTLC